MTCRDSQIGTIRTIYENKETKLTNGAKCFTTYYFEKLRIETLITFVIFKHNKLTTLNLLDCWWMCTGEFRAR